MTKGEKTRLVWTVGIASVLWMAAAAWLLFSNLAPDEVGNHGSNAVKDRMASECYGSFRERYECKEAIIVQSGRDTFWNLAGRFLVVVVPPFFFQVLLQRHLKRNPVKVVIEQAPNYAEWKAKAAQHSHPGAAKHFFGPEQEQMEEIPEGEPEPPKVWTIDDIAPRGGSGSKATGEPDWKTKAQKHINKAKRPE